MHSNVMCTVAGHWKIESFREPRDLYKFCDATAIGDIGLGIRDRKALAFLRLASIRLMLGKLCNPA